MRWLSWALCCCFLIIAALLRKRGGTLAELRLAAQPARTPTKFLVLMMKGRVGSVWLRDLLMANPEILVRHEGLPDQPSARAREMATRRVRRFLDDPASVVWQCARRRRRRDGARPRGVGAAAAVGRARADVAGEPGRRRRGGADRWRRLQLRRRPVPHAVKYGFRTPSAEGRVSTRGSQFYGA